MVPVTCQCSAYLASFEILRYVFTNAGIFETTFFFAWTRVEGAFNHSGEQFQNDAVSVNGLKICGFLKRSGLVWTWP